MHWQLLSRMESLFGIILVAEREEFGDGAQQSRQNDSKSLAIV